MKNILQSLFIFCLLIIFPALAAVDKVRITEVDDIDLGWWVMTSMSGNDPVCIWRNNSDPDYSITVTDSSTITPGSFNLENAAGTIEVPYSLSWGDTPAPGTIPLADGVQLDTTGAHLTNRKCDGGHTANLKVDIPNSTLATLPFGTYTTTVTLLAQP